MTDYVKSKELDQLALAVLDCNLQGLEDANQMAFKIHFSSAKKMKHAGGTCTKVSSAIAVHANFNFVIAINKADWDKRTPEERLWVICHELHHISRSDEGKAKIRIHAGDFCELPNHDLVGLGLAKKAMTFPMVRELIMALPGQQALVKEAPL